MQNQINADHNPDFEVIRKDVSRLQSDMADLLGHLSGNSKDQSSAVREKLKSTSQRALSYSENTIRDRPLMSVMAMFFVGVIMGWLLDRKITK
jgi:ElaB/YqjD/DUF883 family membrane-anchored ribosome-binding protein